MSQPDIARFDPNEVPVAESYARLPLDQIAQVFLDNSAADSNPKTAAGPIANAISSLNSHLEESIYSIDGAFPDTDIPIEILPHHCGADREKISCVQPTAWILDGPNGYYDPNDTRIVRNLVGHWEGRADSLRDHLKNCFTNPCFIAYHAIAIFSIVLGIALWFLEDSKLDDDYPWVRVISAWVLSLSAIIYDVVAMAIIAANEIYYSDDASPVEADLIQKRIVTEIDRVLSEFSGSDAFDQIGDNALLSTSQRAGRFLIQFFYEPSVRIVKELLKPNVLKPATMTWAEYDAVLTIYRFVREISDSVQMGTSQVVLSDTEAMRLRTLILKGITDGSREVHEQLLRLYYKGKCRVDVRQRILLRGNHTDLSINHFIGTPTFQALDAQVKKLADSGAIKHRMRLVNVRFARDPPQPAQEAVQADEE
jgi:hypothetical protein